MEIVKKVTTADEALVYFWQHYVTGEARVHRMTKRVTFQDRDIKGRFVSPEMPKVRPHRLITVHDLMYGDYKIQL